MHSPPPLPDYFSLSTEGGGVRERCVARQWSLNKACNRVVTCQFSSRHPSPPPPEDSEVTHLPSSSSPPPPFAAAQTNGSETSRGRFSLFTTRGLTPRVGSEKNEEMPKNPSCGPVSTPALFLSLSLSPPSLFLSHPTARSCPITHNSKQLRPSFPTPCPTQHMPPPPRHPHSTRKGLPSADTSLITCSHLYFVLPFLSLSVALPSVAKCDHVQCANNTTDGKRVRRPDQHTSKHKRNMVHKHLG